MSSVADGGKMSSNTLSSLTLYNGVRMPIVGFGTYRITDRQEMSRSVALAYQSGYRLFDTASFYKNEELLGRAIEEQGIDRTELFLTSKVWYTDRSYQRCIDSFERSLEALRTDYLDLYLIHWPSEENERTWMALQRLYAEGRVRAIGVSNFSIEQIEPLVRSSHMKPMVNQVELHVGLPQTELVSFCQRHGIAVCASGPLARGNVLSDPQLIQIATVCKRTPGQIALRWLYQRQVAMIPKSTDKGRIEQNIELFDFELSREQMYTLDGIRSERLFTHPEAGKNT